MQFRVTNLNSRKSSDITADSAAAAVSEFCGEKAIFLFAVVSYDSRLNGHAYSATDGRLICGMEVVRRA